MQNIRAVFDIGNGFIKGAIFAQDEGKTVILLKDIIKTKGMRKGKILDSEEFILCLNKMLETFVRKLGGQFIDEAYVGISHPEMIVARIQEHKRIMNGIVKNEDIDHLTKIVQEISVMHNQESVTIQPVYRIIDENKKEKDPVGLEATKLELVADIFYIPKNFYNGLVECFERLNINIVDIMPNILAGSESCLDFDVKDLGVCLVDIGTNQTSYAVYEEGYPLTFGVIPMGGEEVTKDISICMQMDIKEAEELKITKGCVMTEDTKVEPDAEVDSLYLAQIITARYQEIFEKINKQLHKLGKDGRLPSGITLIGGGSKVENIDLLARKIFKLGTFFGKDKQLQVNSDLVKDIQYINTLGIYTWSSKYEHSRRKSPFKMSGDMVGKARNFVREMFF